MNLRDFMGIAAVVQRDSSDLDLSIARRIDPNQLQDYKKPVFESRRIKAIQPGSRWIDRFQEALRLLTGTQPPIDLCESWVIADDERLQQWVNSQRGTPGWVQGIAIIDAARVLADQPVDDEGHQPLIVGAKADDKPCAAGRDDMDPW